MSVKLFFDTNILIHAYDLDAGEKREHARRALQDAWENENGILSTQVLQEFYVNVTRKIPQPIPPAKARGILGNYASWDVVRNGLKTILMASEIEERHRLSFWDSMIVAAAAEGGATRILTEDLGHGQVIEGIEVVNPFR
ncbi:MAG: PIN domain-containing protein [Nitrospira sp.]|nr:PIN domain-containing protein [Nitrospira sp.]